MSKTLSRFSFIGPTAGEKKTEEEGKLAEEQALEEAARVERNEYLERALGSHGPPPPLPSIMIRDTEWLRGYPSSVSNVVKLNWWMHLRGRPDENVLHFNTTGLSSKLFEFSPRATRVAALRLNDAMLFALPRLKATPKGRCFEVEIIEVNELWKDQLAVGICHLELEPPPNVFDDFRISDAWMFGYDGVFVSPTGTTRPRDVDWTPLKEGDVLTVHVSRTIPSVFSLYRNYACIFSTEIDTKEDVTKLPKFFHACVHINGATRILGIRERDTYEFAKQLEQLEQAREEQEREEQVQK